MGLLGITTLSDLGRNHVVATDALDPPHIFNPFPVVKERLAALPPRAGAAERD
jgi:hypothetical protein